MTQYKMVVLDMDDTLMNSDNKLSSGRQQKVCYLLREI